MKTYVYKNVKLYWFHFNYLNHVDQLKNCTGCNDRTKKALQVFMQKS